MPLTDVAPIEASIEIAAPPAKVWALVSDLRNIPRWSPQTAKTFIRGDIKPGTKMFNINRKGFLVWPTQAMVKVVEPEKQIAFKIRENWTTWSFTLEPTDDGGTRLTERRDASDGISDLSVTLTKRVLGGIDDFTASLQSGMEQTLAKIKAEAER